MLRSMTAYARASKAIPLGRFVAEIQSVNRKHLEVQVYLPKELFRFEVEVKQWIGEAISRGYVTARISCFFEMASPVVVRPNVPLAKQVWNAWQQLADELEVKEDSKVSWDRLLQQEGILLYEEDLHDEELYRQGLRQVVDEALASLQAMKQLEGKALTKDISDRLQLLGQQIDFIETRSPDATAKYRQKLKERLEEVLPGRIENEDKLLREVCVFAEKVDIAEEVTRFRSHLAQFKGIIEGSKSDAGKTLEFMCQELLRETNTIGSKSSDMDIAHRVVAIKSELERIREQLQNVE